MYFLKSIKYSKHARTAERVAHGGPGRTAVVVHVLPIPPRLWSQPSGRLQAPRLGDLGRLGNSHSPLPHPHDSTGAPVCPGRAGECQPRPVLAVLSQQRPVCEGRTQGPLPPPLSLCVSRVSVSASLLLTSSLPDPCRQQTRQVFIPTLTTGV